MERFQKSHAARDIPEIPVEITNLKLQVGENQQVYKVEIFSEIYFVLKGEFGPRPVTINSQIFGLIKINCRMLLLLFIIF